MPIDIRSIWTACGPSVLYLTGHRSRTYFWTFSLLLDTSRWDNEDAVYVDWIVSKENENESQCWANAPKSAGRWWILKSPLAKFGILARLLISSFSLDCSFWRRYANALPPLWSEKMAKRFCLDWHLKEKGKVCKNCSSLNVSPYLNRR